MLALMTALVDRDPSNRSAPLSLLPSHLAECSPFMAFELAMLFARVTAAMGQRRPPSMPHDVRSRLRDAADMATGMEILVRYPESFDERMTSGNSILPTFFKLARNRAGKRCLDIVRKLISDWEPCRHGPSRLRAQRQEVGQLTLREAARALRLENGALRDLLDRGLIGAPAGRGVVRKIQWLDPASVSDAGRRLDDRMSLSEFSQTYRIPASGVVQLASLGLLDVNRDPIVEQLHCGLQLHRGVAVELANRLLARRHVPPLGIPLWSLEDVFHGIGAQEKPWGAFLGAALRREIILYCDAQISENLHIGKLQISQRLAYEILAHAHPGLLLVPDIAEPGLSHMFTTRVDVESYLNCFPRDLSWLIAEGHLPPRPRQQEVVNLGRSLISSREISWRWRVSPSFREAMSKDRGIKRTLGPFWSRPQVEGYFAEAFPAGRPI